MRSVFQVFRDPVSPLNPAEPPRRNPGPQSSRPEPFCSYLIPAPGRDGFSDASRPAERPGAGSRVSGSVHPGEWSDAPALRAFFRENAQNCISAPSARLIYINQPKNEKCCVNGPNLSDPDTFPDARDRSLRSGCAHRVHFRFPTSGAGYSRPQKAGGVAAPQIPQRRLYGHPRPLSVCEEGRRGNPPSFFLRLQELCPGKISGRIPVPAVVSPFFGDPRTGCRDLAPLSDPENRFILRRCGSPKGRTPPLQLRTLPRSSPGRRCLSPSPAGPPSEQELSPEAKKAESI